MIPLLYTYDDLAILLAQRGPEACRHTVRRLIGRQGFPRPLAGAAGRFPRAAVDDWLRAHGALPPQRATIADAFALPANDTTPGTSLATLGQQLEQAYG